MDGRQLAMSVQTTPEVGQGDQLAGLRAKVALLLIPRPPPFFFSILASLSFTVSDVLLVCAADAL